MQSLGKSLLHVLVASTLVAAVASPAAAVEPDVQRCRASVVRASTAYAKTAITAMLSCASRRAAGTIAGATDCNDPQQAATALGVPLPATILDDAAAGPCASVTPAEALYTSCPVPCEAAGTADWPAADACMLCTIDARLSTYGDEALGVSSLPLNTLERACHKAVTKNGAKTVLTRLQGHSSCANRGGPSACERPSGKTEQKLRRARDKHSLEMQTRCTDADLVRLDTCATSSTDAGCILAAGDRAATDLVHAISRLLREPPASPSALYSQVVALPAATCALRTDGSAVCWGQRPSLREATPPGRFQQIGAGCWIRDDGTADCIGQKQNWYEEQITPPGTFTRVSSNGSRTCGLRPDATLECWPANPELPEPVTDFAVGSDLICVVRADAQIECQRYYYSPYVHAGSFTKVAVGTFGHCGIHTDGSLECWQNTGNFSALLSPPAGTFTEVSVGVQMACALRSDQSIACWGTNQVGIERPPAGSFTSISVAETHACAMRTDGTFACWGRAATAAPHDQATSLSSDGRCAVRPDASVDCYYEELPGAASAPSGTFTGIEAAASFACGLRPDQSLECWGRDESALRSPPPGSYTDFAASWDRACALRTDGTVACWSWSGNVTSPTGTFLDIASFRYGGNCGIRTAGNLECWGSSSYTPLPGAFVALDGGYQHGCALRDSGSVECWGSNSYGQSAPPSGSWSRLALGDDFSCGLRTDSTLACWGSIEPPPAGTFLDIGAGGDAACGVRSDGTIDCWGQTRWVDPPPAGLYTNISLGADYGCALRNDGEAVCWGNSDHGKHTAPTGSFSSVVASDTHVCGLLTDGTIECWGADYTGLDATPAGSYAQLAHGGDFVCALDDGGAVSCWGDGAVAAPAGTYEQISATSGYYYFYYYDSYACGVRDDGTVSCWGGAVGDPPAGGSFVQVSAAPDHVCARRTDGTVYCWGGDATELAPRGTFLEVATGASFACGLRRNGSVSCWGNAAYSPPPGLFSKIYANAAYACGIRTDATVACWGAIVRP